MRKLLVLVLAGVFLFPSSSYAQFMPPPGDVFATAYYYPFRDEYRAHFASPPFSQWVTLRLYFETFTGTPYYRDFPRDRIMRSVLWLTCNGIYQLQFLDASGNVAFWTDTFVTTQIVHPGCQSYPDAGGWDDLRARYEDDVTTGGYRIIWNDIPEADLYEIWQDGQMVGTVPYGSTTWPVPPPGGSYVIVAKDSLGNYLGHSDINVPNEYDEDGQDGDNGGCNACKWISDALACPEWDNYMGELTRAIRNALPSLPEWRQIADQFVDAFDAYFGPVPNAPTKNHIENNIRPQLPGLDTNVPGSDMTPILPPEYNQPWTFDVTDAPEIPVEDESEPFEIYEPGAYIDADDPGVMVYPGDPRNTSGGIKDPDRINTGYDTPTPSGSTGSPPTIDPPIPQPPADPEIPQSPMPLPAPTEPGMALPTPDIPHDPMPIPDYYGGIIPIPKGGT